MLRHPGALIAEYLQHYVVTQKDFANQINKSVSEVNELIKWKRNITIAWDVLLSDFFKTEPKFRIKKQIDYDYEQFLWILPQDSRIRIGSQEWGDNGFWEPDIHWEISDQSSKSTESEKKWEEWEYLTMKWIFSAF